MCQPQIHSEHSRRSLLTFMKLAVRLLGLCMDTFSWILSHVYSDM